ncbi:MAG: hypothetical protein FD129_1093, partial [bacterium]
MDEAETEAQLAWTLDPLSNVAIAFAGWFPYWRGRFEEAVRRFEAVVDMIPGFGQLYYWMGLSLARVGRDADAVSALMRGIELLGRTPQIVAALAIAHSLAGRRAEAMELMAEMESQSAHRYSSAYYRAQVYAAMDEPDAAFRELETAFEERSHWLAAIRIDPSLAALRFDPRFESLVARITNS